jgi:CDGSH iron-sulfur domain-containing protein 3
LCGRACLAKQPRNTRQQPIWHNRFAAAEQTGIAEDCAGRTKVTERQIAQKAPYPVDVEPGRTYYWCACGQSKKQPLQKDTGITPVAWMTAEKTGPSYFCGCKQSKNEPLCDGSHAAEPGCCFTSSL